MIKCGIITQFRLMNDQKDTHYERKREKPGNRIYREFLVS